MTKLQHAWRTCNGLSHHLQRQAVAPQHLSFPPINISHAVPTPVTSSQTLPHIDVNALHLDEDLTSPSLKICICLPHAAHWLSMQQQSAYKPHNQLQKKVPKSGRGGQL
jgi:hypothetical protein